jgi:hypothetical protein
MSADKVPFVVCIWDDAWADATAGTTLQDAHEKHMPTVMETRGWLVVDTDRGISLFYERCLDKGEEYYRGRTFIPRPLIRSLTPVILTTPRKRREKVPAQPAPVGDN